MKFTYFHVILLISGNLGGVDFGLVNIKPCIMLVNYHPFQMTKSFEEKVQVDFNLLALACIFWHIEADKMSTISQTFLSAFSWMKSFEF